MGEPTQGGCSSLRSGLAKDPGRTQAGERNERTWALLCKIHQSIGNFIEQQGSTECILAIVLRDGYQTVELIDTDDRDHACFRHQEIESRDDLAGWQRMFLDSAEPPASCPSSL